MCQRPIAGMGLLLRWAGLLSLLLLSACSTFSGAPPRLTSVDVLAAEDPDYKLALETFYRQEDDTGRQSVRNQFVETRIAIIDHEYLKFRQTLYQDRIGVDLMADLGLLSLNALGATVSSSAAKTTYAALSAVVVGGKSSIDKNVYFERTLVAMLSQMDTLRNNKKIDLFKGLTQPIANYPLSYAKADTDEYYLAGTIARAIQGVNAETAATAVKSQIELTKQMEIRNNLERQGIEVIPPGSDDLTLALEKCYSVHANQEAIKKVLKGDPYLYTGKLSEFSSDPTRLQQRSQLLSDLRAKGLCK